MPCSHRLVGEATNMQSSSHVGGMNVLFADGSVRFVSVSLSLQNYEVGGLRVLDGFSRETAQELKLGALREDWKALPGVNAVPTGGLRGARPLQLRGPGERDPAPGGLAGARAKHAPLPPPGRGGGSARDASRPRPLHGPVRDPGPPGERVAPSSWTGRTSPAWPARSRSRKPRFLEPGRPDASSPCRSRLDPRPRASSRRSTRRPRALGHSFRATRLAWSLPVCQTSLHITTPCRSERQAPTLSFDSLSLHLLPVEQIVLNL